ncbi:unnamed protein product [Oikopleura dioica]|uniref:NADP-dependent oxidoreductase domain-containing protein n=1 Tax=Oikopleura dioica TaxID=34765 RepID=E4X6Z5_OIKDI|nr:unnamed protein product [Oikopleura dioica]
MSAKMIKASLGTMEMGRNATVGDIPKKMVELFLNNAESIGADEIDTAFMYVGGKTEKVLGTIPAWKKPEVGMATKVNPWNGKGLGKESVRKQLETSLANMRVKKVQICYLHAPDHETPLHETLAAMNEMHQEGKFDELGLSNYSSWLVAEAVNICKQKGFIVPTVYQGMYSAITRQVEVELIPCLRYHNLRFYAYSPLGGGIMTGKHKFKDDEEQKIEFGRFNMGNNGWDKVYRDRYWKVEHFNAMEKIKELLLKHHGGENATVAETAYRWLLHHSALSGEKGDRIVIGASRVEQLEVNMGYMNKGPLHEELVQFMDEWWKSTSHFCPSYLR